MGALAAGGAVIVVTNALIMLGTIWIFEAQYPELVPLLPQGALTQIAALAHEFSPTGGFYMLPVFLWGVVLLSPVLPSRLVRQDRVGRTALCPRGSGKKYKACCGR